MAEKQIDYMSIEVEFDCPECGINISILDEQGTSVDPQENFKFKCGCGWEYYYELVATIKYYNKKS